MDIVNLIQKQRNFFNNGNTLCYKTRKQKLIQLKQAIKKFEPKLYQAIYQDLGKSETETYMCEIGLVLSDLTYQLKHLKKNMKPKRKPTPLSQFKSKSYILPSPYGVTLVIAPWNYPILLAIEPVVGALAAGNTVILKPSEYSLNTSLVLQELFSSVFCEEYVSVVLGDATVSATIVQQKFDYIFFTGGTNIGKKIALEAAKNLTPITLELGGKSPVIVDETAKISLATKRIVFGKFLNAGQTCVAPDYVLVHQSLKNKFIEKLIFWIEKLYPSCLENPDYVRMINEQHYKRILNYFSSFKKILYGGKIDAISLKIEPTLVDVDEDSLIMQEEIFGPILPILSYDSKEDLCNILRKNPNPLALYIFSTNKKNILWLTTNISFGGGCINDTIIHLATNELAFGGVGESGIGKYHGKESFATFTHYKSLLSKANWLDLPIRYTPYTKNKKKLLHLFLK